MRAALLASDGYLVPVQNEELCRDSLDALLEFIDTFRDRNFAEDPADEPQAAFTAGGLRRKLAPWHTDVDATFSGWADVWLTSEFHDWSIEPQLRRNSRASVRTRPSSASGVRLSRLQDRAWSARWRRQP